MIEIDLETVELPRVNTIEDISRSEAKRIHDDATSVVVKKSQGSGYKTHIPHPDGEKPLCDDMNQITCSTGQLEWRERPIDQFPLAFCDWCKVCGQLYRDSVE